MEVSVESISNLERKITVQVPANEIDSEVESRLKSLSGRVQLKGFRPGKVPFKVVKQRYGSEVYNEVIGEKMQSTFREAVEKESLRPAGMPTIDPIDPQPGSALEYTAVFEVYPEVELKSLTDVQLKQPQVEIADSDLEAMVAKLREQNQLWEDVERASVDGDQVVVDFEGFIDDEPFEGGKAEGTPLLLGSGRMIPGFEEQLVGVKTGENKTLTVTFPEDYHADNLKGKEARFEASVQKVSAPKLPELDEEFISKFGVEGGDVEAFHADVRANMQREADQAIRNRVKNEVMDKLIELHDIEVPRALISGEVETLRKQAMQNFGQQSADINLPDELFEEEAKKRVALGLLVGQIIRDNKIELDQDRVDVTLDELAATYQEPEQLKQYYRSNKDALATVEAMVIEEQVVDWIKSQSQISDETLSFDELMNPAQGNDEE